MQSYEPSVTLPPPRWLASLAGLDDDGPPWTEHIPGLLISLHTTPAITFVRACIPNAVDLHPLDVQRLSTCAYQRIGALIREGDARCPIRFWNLIPNIVEPIDDVMDRYMVFNAGRYAAYCDWYGGPEAFAENVATATGIGHDGRDLLIYALASDRAGVHMTNPRQTQPHGYSQRFGPLPPCFARATVADGLDDDAKTVLIGGTASIRGEETVCVGDVAGQTAVTMENIAALIGACCRRIGVDVPEDAPVEEVLRRVTSLYVYCVHREDMPAVEQVVRRFAPHVSDVPCYRADICRPELLVEIEGTARAGRL